MPAAGWLVVGVIIGLASLRTALRLVASIAPHDVAHRTGRFVWVARVAAGVVGAATAWIASSASASHAAVLATVAVLVIVQTPADLITHRLSRPATFVATATISAVVTADAFGSGAPRTILGVLGWTSVVVAIYAAMHRVSPRSLGWGDVLLVIPLSLAVGFVTDDRLVAWQLIAATSGAVHAVVRRTVGGGTVIPFGPHLLVSAWVVLATSV